MKKKEKKMRKSAKRLGAMIGLDAKEVNLKLAEKGYLSGRPGNWLITEEGKKHGDYSYHDNGYGGRAGRTWEYPVWDSEIAYELGDPDAHLAKINKSLKDAGLPPISWDD